MSRNPQPTIRTFIAVELPPQVHALLATVQEELRESMDEAANAVKWVRPQGTHLTLQFLGGVPASSIERIAQGLRDACASASAFTLEVAGLGAFPNPRRPRVIWVGLTGDRGSMAALGSLHESIAGHMKTLGFRPDNSFKPHLTLGRIRETARRDELESMSNTLQYPEAQPTFATTFDVTGISLMRSDLNPGGAVYTQLAHVQFERPA
jgi:RNA 2',3'-cyclic 3'-phosphodiesterase